MKLTSLLTNCKNLQHSVACYLNYLGSVEHRAQVILYSLMMMERYKDTLDTGLLLYLKTGHMLGVPAYMHEKRALVMKRNELIRYLAHTGTRVTHTMPGRMVGLPSDIRIRSHCLLRLQVVNRLDAN